MNKLAMLSAIWLATCFPAFAAGDLATRAVKLPPLELGGGDLGYGVSVPKYELESGKAYKLTIHQVGPHGCEWEAEDLTRNIWIRNIEVEHVTIAVSGLEGFQLDDDAEVDITFVPIRTGEFEWECDGLGEQGLQGSFEVK